jgi:hypothetical protein
MKTELQSEFCICDREKMGRGGRKEEIGGGGDDDDHETELHIH